MRIIKKTIILLLVLLSALTFSLSVGCKNVETPPPAVKKGTLTLSMNELSVSTYETKYIIATKKGIAEDVVWSSSAPEVAKVEDGAVTGLTVGTTDIIATAGDFSATCKVTVGLTIVEPTISLDFDAVKIKEGDSITVTPIVKWQGEEIEGGAFNYYAQNTEVATTSKNGDSVVITAVKQGETTVTVKVDVRGKTAYEEIQVTVVREELSFNIENEDYDITTNGYSIKIASEKINEHENTTKPEFYATYKGQKVENLNITWSTEDSEVVEVDLDGQITAIKAGKAIVTGEYYFETLDKTYTLSIFVEIYKPEIDIGTYCFALNRQEPILQLETSETTANIFVGDAENGVEISINNGEIILDNTLFPRDTVNLVKIETKKLIFVGEVEITDHLIGSIEEFNAWYNGETYLTDSVTLENDIDFASAGKYWNSPKVTWNDTGYQGIFNGNGHVISNFTSTDGFIPTVGSKGVIKNLSLINLVTGGNTGLLGFQYYGLMENCYVEGARKDATIGDYYSGTYGALKSKAKFVNVVVIVSGEQEDVSESYGVSAYREWNVSFSGLYVVNTNSNGEILKGSSRTDGISFFTSLEEMKASVNIVPKEFDENVWTIENGLLTKIDVIEYYEDNALTINEISNVRVNKTYTLSANYTDVIFTVEGLDENVYELNGNELIITNLSALGSEFTIKATYASQDGLYIATAESGKIFVASETVVLDDVFVAKNRAGDSVVVSIVDKALEFKGSINGEEKTTLSYANGEVSIPISEIDESGKYIVEIQLLNQNGFAEHDYQLEIEVIDHLIGSIEEFNAWYNGSTYLTDNVMLEKDIDFASAGKYWNSPKVTWNDTGYQGTFDGNGHVISNFTSTDGFIPTVGSKGVIKNLSLINLVTGSNTGLLGFQFYGLMENCYVEGARKDATIGDYYSGTYGAVKSKAKFVNVVVIVSGEQEDVSKSYGVSAYREWNVSFSGLYVVNTNSNGEILKDSSRTDGISFFTSLEEMKESVTVLPQGFDQTLWTIENGELVKHEVVEYRSKQ